MHVRVKRALHVHATNSFRPFRLELPKGKVAGREKAKGELHYMCEEQLWLMNWCTRGKKKYVYMRVTVYAVTERARQRGNTEKREYESDGEQLCVQNICVQSTESAVRHR